jgi:bifunctional DNA-binding transcriptional regulator/antitoxin component of YhaV-PrlF toxin-antitoxin module
MSPHEEIVTVTKKGQATIPKSMRVKHRIGKKVLAVDTKEGVMLLPLPDPSMEKGSLRKMLKGTSSEIMKEVRRSEVLREDRLFRKRGTI